MKILIFLFFLIQYTQTQEDNNVTISKNNTGVNLNATVVPKNITEGLNMTTTNTTDVIDLNERDIVLEKEIQHDKEVLSGIKNISADVYDLDTVVSTEQAEWEQKISEFDAAEIITLDIPAHQSETLYEHIDHIPSIIKLAYVINQEGAIISFKIRDPNNILIYKHSKSSAYFHEFTASVAGEYQFILDNSSSKLKQRVSFAIHQGNSTNTHLSRDNLDNVYFKLVNITRSIKVGDFTSRMLSKKYDAKYDVIKNHNKNIVLLSLVEIALMILIFFLQLFYIKKVAKNNTV
jgi:hypothetical protein